MQAFKDVEEQKAQLSYGTEPIQYRRFRNASKSPTEEYLSSENQEYLQRYVGNVTNKRHFNYDVDSMEDRRKDLTNIYATSSKYSRTEDSYERKESSYERK